MGFLRDNALPGVKCLTVVADFWVPKTKMTKYLGLRVYMITKSWKFKSILLGTRHFNRCMASETVGFALHSESGLK